MENQAGEGGKGQAVVVSVGHVKDSGPYSECGEWGEGAIRGSQPAESYDLISILK